MPRKSRYTKRKEAEALERERAVEKAFSPLVKIPFGLTEVQKLHYDGLGKFFRGEITSEQAREMLSVKDVSDAS